MMGVIRGKESERSPETVVAGHRASGRPPRSLVVVASLILLFSLSSTALAEDLKWEADATYSVDVDEGVLQVEAVLVLTNQKPDSRSGNVITQYFYDLIEIYIPENAVNVSMTTEGEALDYETNEVDEEGFEGFQLATIYFTRNIFYKQSTTVHIEYDLPGDPPRGDTAFRVNPAYVFFAAFAWGDPAGTTMRVILPSEFDAEIVGAEVESTSSDGLVTYTIGEFDDPEVGSVLVQARNESSLTSTDTQLERFGVIVRAWPDDDAWEAQVVAAVEAGLPELARLVGLDWVPTQDVEIVESQDVSLAGYGGWYLNKLDRIEIGEWVDPHLVLHELSHSWFNGTLFRERWILEGLAEAFATAAAESAGLEVPEDERPLSSHHRPAWADDLNDWAPPDFEAPTNEEAETYGYETSLWVMQQLIDEIGLETLASVIAAAANDEIAYRGEPSPETVAGVDDWRRFLDLLVEVGGSEAAVGLFEQYVTSADLDERAVVRAEYENLTSTGWEAPLYVRTAMSTWDFSLARSRMEEASSVLEVREAIADNALKIGVEPPPSLEAAYESAVGSMDAPALLAAEQLASTDEVLAARRALVAERDWFTDIGLMGEDPVAEMDQAIAAFAADDLDLASIESQEVVELMDDADDVGRTRVLIAALIFFGLVGLTIGIVSYRKRRTRETEARAVSIR